MRTLGNGRRIGGCRTGRQVDQVRARPDRDLDNTRRATVSDLVVRITEADGVRRKRGSAIQVDIDVSVVRRTGKREAGGCSRRRCRHLGGTIRIPRHVPIKRQGGQERIGNGSRRIDNSRAGAVVGHRKVGDGTASEDQTTDARRVRTGEGQITQIDVRQGVNDGAIRSGLVGGNRDRRRLMRRLVQRADGQASAPGDRQIAQPVIDEGGDRVDRTADICRVSAGARNIDGVDTDSISILQCQASGGKARACLGAAARSRAIAGNRCRTDGQIRRVAGARGVNVIDHKGIVLLVDRDTGACSCGGDRRGDAGRAVIGVEIDRRERRVKIRHIVVVGRIDTENAEARHVGVGQSRSGLVKGTRGSVKDQFVVGRRTAGDLLRRVGRDRDDVLARRAGEALGGVIQRRGNGPARCRREAGGQFGLRCKETAVIEAGRPAHRNRGELSGGQRSKGQRIRAGNGQGGQPRVVEGHHGIRSRRGDVQGFDFVVGIGQRGDFAGRAHASYVQGERRVGRRSRRVGDRQYARGICWPGQVQGRQGIVFNC